MKKFNTFWLISLLLLLMATCLLWYVAPAAPTLWANAHHNRILDFFFKWTTKIAEWPVVAVAILLAFVQHWKTGIWVGLCYGLEAMVVALVKILLKAPRPSMETGISALHQVPGEAIHSYYSFPSGHTAAAFVGFGFISLMSKNKWTQGVCAAGAALVAYSRMYLGQHYLRDLVGGASIALLVLALYQWTHERMIQWKWNRNDK